MNFPQFVSFTVTNACNLRCKMCGQWSEEGYIYQRKENPKQEMRLEDWKRLVDEIADHGTQSVLIRGGEPFLFPGIIGLLDYINGKGIFTSIDTNGTLLAKVAADVVRIGNIHLTISVDGPEEIHDAVRGVKGCFVRVEEGLRRLTNLEKESGRNISRSICFTISPYSLKGLGRMPDVARRLAMNTLVIVPYCFVTGAMGKIYENELGQDLDSLAFSWKGFRRDHSGVDFNQFLEQFQEYKRTLGDIYSYPYLKLTEDEYRDWFQDAAIPVGPFECANVERLIDIQTDGNANFCVDLPDYGMGNVRDATISEIWNSERAERFRAVRREKRFAACNRCVAKYMSVVRE